MVRGIGIGPKPTAYGKYFLVPVLSFAGTLPLTGVHPVPLTT